MKGLNVAIIEAVINLVKRILISELFYKKRFYESNQVETSGLEKMNISGTTDFNLNTINERLHQNV